MEKYLMLILLAAPGFVASSIAKGFGVATAKRGEFESLANYLSYSFFSILLTVTISAALGIVDLNGNWQSFSEKLSSVKISVEVLLIALISGASVGILWSLWLSNLFIKALNKINILCGRNKRNLNGSLLNRLFDDGSEHFVLVQKDGRDLAVGFIFSASDPFDEKTELAITEYPQYREELKKAKEGKETPLANTRQVYIDVENGIVITETDYPSDW